MLKLFAAALSCVLVQTQLPLFVSSAEDAPAILTFEELRYQPQTFAERYGYLQGRVIEMDYLSQSSLNMNAFLLGLKNGAGMETSDDYYAYAREVDTLRLKVSNAPNDAQLEALGSELNQHMSLLRGQYVYLKFDRIGLKPDIAAVLAGAFDARDRTLDKDVIGDWAEINAAYKQRYSQASMDRSVDYLSQLSQQLGVETTASGLRYQIIQDGEGESPKRDDQVKVYFTGWSLSNTKMVPVKRPGPPAVLAVSELIPGWQEALSQMKPGAIWDVHLPPELGYGGQKLNYIDVNDVLSFTIELVEVVED